MRRIPSIFGASNHIHRNIPNDAFMDLEEIRYHLPELLDLRELLLHLDYEDSEPVSEGKCVLKEATKSFVPIYVKPIVMFNDDVPQDFKDLYENISLESWAECFYTNDTKPFNADPCGFKPIVSGEYICLPIPLGSFFGSYTQYFYVENPNKDFIKIESTEAVSSDGTAGTVPHLIHTYPSDNTELPVMTSDGSYGEVAEFFNKFNIKIGIDVSSNVSENWNNGNYIPVKKETSYGFSTISVDPVGLDLTPVTFTKLVRNEE